MIDKTKINWIRLYIDNSGRKHWTGDANVQFAHDGLGSISAEVIAIDRVVFEEMIDVIENMGKSNVSK
jgi:hypothetical protein